MNKYLDAHFDNENYRVINNSKPKLIERGLELLSSFGKLNKIPSPKIEILFKQGRWPKSAGCCKGNHIVIFPMRCSSAATEATAPESKFYPGYIKDKTPYGVLAHEYGHYIANIHGPNFEKNLRKVTKENSIHGFKLTPPEWFAENFKLFMTNPKLFKIINPKTYDALCQLFTPVETREISEILKYMPKSLKLPKAAKF